MITTTEDIHTTTGVLTNDHTGHAHSSTSERLARKAMADGEGPDPATPPRCPDCHGELLTETIGDEDDADWCAYCGTVVRMEVAV